MDNHQAWQSRQGCGSAASAGVEAQLDKGRNASSLARGFPVQQDTVPPSSLTPSPTCSQVLDTPSPTPSVTSSLVPSPTEPSPVFHPCGFHLSRASLNGFSSVPLSGKAPAQVLHLALGFIEHHEVLTDHLLKYVQVPLKPGIYEHCGTAILRGV